METKPPPLPPLPTWMTIEVAETTLATETTNNWMITLGDQTGEDQANSQIDTTTRRISRANLNTVDNRTNLGITRSMVGQGLVQM